MCAAGNVEIMYSSASQPPLRDVGVGWRDGRWEDRTAAQLESLVWLRQLT